MTTFSGLDIARRALSASQTAIDVAGHNIANANTAGFTRQRLQTVAIDPAAGYSRLAATGSVLTGGGVEVVTVEQIRNPFLDGQYRNENALGSEWGTRAEGLAYIEQLFDELSDTGLSQSISDFSSSLHELSKNPVPPEYRTNVLQNGLKLAETFQHYATQLADKQSEQNQTVQVITSRINSISQSIADLNVQIARYELSGQKANDLRDQRNLQLDQLSGLVDFNASENDSGQLQIKIGGQFLISYDQVRLLKNEMSVDNPLTQTADSLYSVVWADDSTLLEINSGSLMAVLDLRDGNSADQIGLPFMGEQLNRLTAALASSFNEIHESGWSLPDFDSGSVSESGIAFFTTQTDAFGQPLPMTAATITVNPAISADLKLIAASSEQVTADTMTSNNQNVLKLTALFFSQDIPDIGSLNGFLNGFIGEIAVESAQARAREDNQAILTASLEEQRQSVSGVSLDEEMSNLVRYQHSYSAAARLITAIDESLDVLINRTGIVGR